MDTNDYLEDNYPMTEEGYEYYDSDHDTALEESEYYY